MIVRFWYPEIFKKNIRHLRVIMLTRMDQDLFVLFPELNRDRGTFDKLWPGPNNRYNLHNAAGLFSFLFITTSYKV
jgi:hypothetical protein